MTKVSLNFDRFYSILATIQYFGNPPLWTSLWRFVKGSIGKFPNFWKLYLRNLWSEWYEFGRVVKKWRSVYSYFDIGSQSGSASPWRIGTCPWRDDGDRRLSAVRKMERRLGHVNVRPTLRQWEGRWSPSSTYNYVLTLKQQNTLQLTTIMKIAVTTQKFESVASNLHGIVFYDVIWN